MVPLPPGMMTVPGQIQMTPEEWAADQAKKQLAHAKGWVTARKQQIREAEAYNAAQETAEPQPVGHGVRTLGKEIDGVTEQRPVPKMPRVPAELSAPARGPKVEHGEYVADAQVPVARGRKKKKSKVAEARRQARLRRVLSG
jgi:hypothetical protein